MTVVVDLEEASQLLRDARRLLERHLSLPAASYLVRVLGPDERLLKAVATNTRNHDLTLFT